ncbi:hypothetical protein GDO78_014541 [Eleutherodactylus coqui]|uniref:Ig-like domain-containing protein n=1 Tax=Eleutherodactylus coqui TaxID=57060 RepID=A0A8J6ELA4_ELECQ|nr:hypothetical protein GDO78_014541 [Eleutherodactylus coqui]
MMRVLLLLLTASTLLPSCGAVRVDQQPKLLIVKTGDSVNLTCEQDQSTYFNMYWYQQKPEQGLKLMVLSLEVDKPVDMEEGYKATWTLRRPTVYNSTLILNPSSQKESAVYFCASSIHSLREQRLVWK